MKTDELLKVLDMPEDEQIEWLYKYATDTKLEKTHAWLDFCLAYHSGLAKVALADLAFRLRDEAVNKGHATEFYDGMSLVLKHYQKNDCVPSMTSFLVYHAQPIHWIIAALIAKEKQ